MHSDIKNFWKRKKSPLLFERFVNGGYPDIDMLPTYDDAQRDGFMKFLGNHYGETVLMITHDNSAQPLPIKVIGGNLVRFVSLS